MSIGNASIEPAPELESGVGVREGGRAEQFCSSAAAAAAALEPPASMLALLLLLYTTNSARANHASANNSPSEKEWKIFSLR